MVKILEVEKEVVQFTFKRTRLSSLKLDENYGEPLTEGTYKVKHDIYNLDGEVVINIRRECRIYRNNRHNYGI